MEIVITKSKSKTRGQTLTEYLLLVCLLAVGSLPIITILSNVLRDRVEVAAKRIGGQTRQSEADSILKSSDKKVRRGMHDFWKQ